MLPSLPGGPPFQLAGAVLKTHKLSDVLSSLRKMNVSAKVKLQAARYTCYLDQWREVKNKIDGHQQI